MGGINAFDLTDGMSSVFSRVSQTVSGFTCNCIWLGLKKVEVVLL